MSYNQSLKSDGRAQLTDMNKPVIHLIPKYELNRKKDKLHLSSYISYFIFALTPEVEHIIDEKMESNNWYSKMALTGTEYKIIMAHLIYTGSDQHSSISSLQTTSCVENLDTKED